MMKSVRLKGVSTKGKNVVRNHGEDWAVIGIRDSLPRFGQGPFALVESKKDKDMRWIHLTSEPNFIIIEES